jgi:hypothetical protein
LGWAGGFVDDGGVFLVSEIKHADAGVGGDRGEDADAAPGDVVDFFIVRYELGVYDAAFYVPDSYCGVDGGCCDASWVDVAPVERCDWGASYSVIGRVFVITVATCQVVV